VCRTQQGNNNAYCQDNEISWTNWDLSDEARDLLEFTRRASKLMREHPVLRRRRFFQGRQLRGADVKDIMWLAPTGQEMTEVEWQAGHVRCLGVRLAGDAIGEIDEDGAPVVGDTLVYLMNAGGETVPFRLPAFAGRPWELLMDTAERSREGRVFRAGTQFQLADHSLAVFRMR
jgi:glycogen operon protein